MLEVKKLSFKQLLDLNSKALHNNKNKSIDLGWIKDNENKMFPIGKVDGTMSYTRFRDLTFLIPWKFCHNEEEWRCQIMYTPDKSIWLDMDFSEYNKLESAIKGENDAIN
jgi:hypothetical protein|tara:strand:- start:2106 stop:2435 length:330 start_codon:yes stop_codon:yes gene_type:complete